MRNTLKLFIEFISKLCFELFLVLPLIKDIPSTMDKQLIPKVSSLQRFHCIEVLPSGSKNQLISSLKHYIIRDF